MSFNSTKIIELGSCAFRQPRAKSHCRFIHGYRLVAKFWFSCNELDENNWVVDFGSLKGLKDKGGWTLTLPGPRSPECCYIVKTDHPV